MELKTHTPRPALAQMFRERAERMKTRGYWNSRGIIVYDTEKCIKKRQELLDLANMYDDPELYNNFIEE